MIASQKERSIAYMKVGGKMASKYLGTLGKWDFFIATTFGEYRDEEAVREIQHAKYKLITEGRRKDGKPINIFCTAINLDHETKREISFFDDLETTYHIFAIKNSGNDKGKLGCSCSYAFESQEKANGIRIGLPLENKINNGYPEGFDLDEFRERYEYRGRKSKPEERVELFRHFKLPEYLGDKVANIGVYRGGFQEFVKERLKKGETPKTKWLFCSKPTYYQYLYRPLSAMLVPLLMNGISHDEASPPLNEISILDDNHTKDSGGCFYNGIKISYRHPIIISQDNKEEKTERWFDYIPQIIDLERGDDIIKEDNYFKNHKHLNWIACRIIVEDLFVKNHNDPINNVMNYLAKRLAKAYPFKGWDTELIQESAQLSV